MEPTRAMPSREHPVLLSNQASKGMTPPPCLGSRGLEFSFGVQCLCGGYSWEHQPNYGSPGLEFWQRLVRIPIIPLHFTCSVGSWGLGNKGVYLSKFYTDYINS